MPLLVRLHVYSGQPDPVWTLSDDQEKELTVKLREHKLKKKPLLRGLGYRGFSVLETEADKDIQPMLFKNTESDEIIGSFVAGEPEIEDYLLWTGSETLDDELTSHVQEVMFTEGPKILSEKKLASVSCPPCGGGDAPSYNPSYWNNNSTRRRSNNCYNYANNRATNTFAQPGRGSGQMYRSLTCGSVGPAAVRDGLRRVPSFRASTPGWYTALVIWPNRDYHWYRQDRNGCWSHKPGQTNARNTDNSGRRIVDPRRCDRGPYVNFCSYYVTNRGVRIR